MGREKPKILVSWISLVWSLLSVKQGAKLARWAGFDGLQGAPTRGMPPYRPRRYLEKVDSILPIFLYEDVWCKNEEKWGPLDRLVFDNTIDAGLRFDAFAYFERSRRIDHEFGKGRLIEAHPGLWMTPQQVADRAGEHEIDIVWDTYHARRRFFFPVQEEEKPVGLDSEVVLEAWSDWRSYLPLLAPHITVVHVQPLRGTDELQRWLKDDYTELGDMLLELRRQCLRIQYYVVELLPPYGLVKKVLWVLTLPLTMRKVQWVLRSLV